MSLLLLETILSILSFSCYLSHLRKLEGLQSYQRLHNIPSDCISRITDWETKFRQKDSSSRS